MIRTSIAICAVVASLLTTTALAQNRPVDIPTLSIRDRIKADRAKDREDMKLDTKRPWDKPRSDAVYPAPPPLPVPAMR